MNHGSLQFGPFEFDPLSLELRRAGRRIRLRPQSARALALLLANPGSEISREALRTHLWNDGTFVDYETGLNTCIRRLRHALGDDARRPRFVLTLPGRGYRFIMPAVTREAPPASGSPTDHGRAGSAVEEEPSLARDTCAVPEDRPGDATDNFHDPDPEGQAASSRRPEGTSKRRPAHGRRGRVAWFVGLAASILVVLSTGGAWGPSDAAADAPSPSAPAAASNMDGADEPRTDPSNDRCPSPSSRPIYAIVARVEILKDEPEMGRSLVRIFRSGLKQSPHIQLMPGPRFRTGLARLANARDDRAPNRDHILRLGRVERADAVILIRVSRSPFPGNTDYFFEAEIIDVATHSLVFDAQVIGETEEILARRVEQTVRRATEALHDLAPRW